MVLGTGPEAETELYKLMASDGSPSDWFGLAVAIDGGRIAVGAPNNDRGLVYIYDLATGQEIHTLQGPGAAPDGLPGFVGHQG